MFEDVRQNKLPSPVFTFFLEGSCRIDRDSDSDTLTVKLVQSCENLAWELLQHETAKIYSISYITTVNV